MNNYKKRRTRVIVCGVGFGQFYLKALENLVNYYELVGIFSKGSAWSKEVAERYNVPLFTDLKRITHDIADAVCVVIKSTVVGGKGSDIVHSLLKKGINVIQEHPVHPDDYIECLKLSKMYNCKYSLNTFYPELKNVSKFIQLSNRLRQYSAIKYINADCSVHVLFPLIDILGRALGGLRPWSFHKIDRMAENVMFCTVLGYLNGIPICLNVQNQIEPKDPENYMNLFHRITVTTNSGSLIMTGTNGVVVWESCINKTLGSDGVFHLDKDDEFSALPVYEIAGTDSNISYKQLLTEIWPESIRKSLIAFRKEIVDDKTDNGKVQYLIEAINVWNQLGKEIGSPQIINQYIKRPISLKDFS